MVVSSRTWLSGSATECNESLGSDAWGQTETLLSSTLELEASGQTLLSGMPKVLTGGCEATALATTEYDASVGVGTYAIS